MPSLFHAMAKVYFLLLTLLLPSFIASTDQVSNKAHQCLIGRLTASYPSNKTVSEAGMIEKWDEEEDQMQCAGIGAIRITLGPGGLSLPSFDPAPRIAYVLQGKAVLGMSYPWCPLTFGSEKSSDRYQKILKVKKGDIVAVPPGAVHWCYNDGDDELLAITIVDLKSALNQLDPSFKTLYLAGNLPGWEGQEGESRQKNVITAFDTDLMAEAMGISEDLMQKIQRKDERGVLVKVRKEEMRTITPEVEDWEGMEMTLDKRETKDSGNGVDEPFCNIRLMENIDDKRDADVISRKSGWLSSINKHKLPFLGHIELSAEKGSLCPNAFLVPHWSINAHTIIFVTQGEGYLQVVDNQGRRVFNGSIKEGQLTVVPQYFASMMRAESRGIEWISFKTSSLPMRSPLVGDKSTFKGLPLQVIANSYRVPISKAFKLKFNREHDMMLFPPSTTYY